MTDDGCVSLHQNTLASFVNTLVLDLKMLHLQQCLCILRNDLPLCSGSFLISEKGISVLPSMASFLGRKKRKDRLNLDNPHSTNERGPLSNPSVPS